MVVEAQIKREKRDVALIHNNNEHDLIVVSARERAWFLEQSIMKIIYLSLRLCSAFPWPFTVVLEF